MSEVMTDTKDETLSEDEKASFLEDYRRVGARYDALYRKMEAEGYIRDREREEKRFKCEERLSDFNTELREVAAHVGSYGLEFVEEDGVIFLRDTPPEVLAERERKQREGKQAVADAFDDPIPF